MELGALLIIMVISVALYILRIIIVFFASQCQPNCLTKRFGKPVHLRIAVVRFLSESCIEIGLVALIAIAKSDKANFKTF